MRNELPSTPAGRDLMHWLFNAYTAGSIPELKETFVDWVKLRSGVEKMYGDDAIGVDGLPDNIVRLLAVRFLYEVKGVSFDRLELSPMAQETRKIFSEQTEQLVNEWNARYNTKHDQITKALLAEMSVNLD